MNPGRNPDAAGIVALALAFHRSPVRYAELLRGRTPLPPGVGTLLKLAGGSAPGPEYAALARPDELRTAAMFFIEQVLFHHDGNHYRVLGLAPNAPAEQIKEHHRLLMRIFHPDRERDADDWKDAFATRINLAYTSLHDPEARRRYDATLKPAMRPGMTPPPARQRAVLRARPLVPSRGLPPVLLHYLPQWVLAGTALLALVTVGSVYVNNLPAPTAFRTPPPLPAEAHPRQSAASLPAGKKPSGETEIPSPPIESAGLAQATANLLPPAPVAAPPSAHPQAAPLQPAPILMQNAHAVAPTAKARRLSIAPVAPQPSGKSTAAPVTRVDPVPSPTPRQEASASPIAQPEPQVSPARPAQPDPLDPNAALALFVSAFERGDTPTFMALFDEVAIGKAGGKAKIRQEYESLIQSTDLRHIAIDKMAWAQEGDWMRGEGRYRTTLMRKGTLRLQTETGTIRIELLRRGDHSLIMGLDYQPGEGS